MKFKLLFLFLTFISFKSIQAQTVSETPVFHLTYKGNPDPYNLMLDSVTGKYIYMYWYEEQAKTFLISDNSVSEQFDFISISDTKFDSRGNFFTTAGNYNADYGIDNYFLIINNKNTKNYDYIESYSAYVNDNDQYVFIFKEFGYFKLGYINAAGEMTQSESFDAIKPIQKSYPYVAPGDPQPDYTADMFFTNAQGNRGYVVIKDGKAGFWFGGDDLTMTDYSDINEASVVYDNNGNMAFVAKSSGKFYDYDNPNTGEFVVANNSQYNSFKGIVTPIVFTTDNTPVYVVSDSLSEYMYKYYAVIGNDRQYPTINGNQIDGFTGYIYDLRRDDAGNIRYNATTVYQDESTSKMQMEYAYDYMTYDVTNNNALELGISIGVFRKSPTGTLIYSAVDPREFNPEKRRYSLMQYSNGVVSKYTDNVYNNLLDYGFSPDGELYYVMDKYENYTDYYSPMNASTEVLVEGKKYNCQSLTYFGDAMTSGYLCFSKNGDYAFAENKLLDTVSYANLSVVMTNNGALPFKPASPTNAKGYNYITNMFYTPGGQLVYAGSYYSDMSDLSIQNNEIVINNQPTGQVYGMLSFLDYDEASNTISFLGQRGKDIYKVNINLNN